MRGANLPNALGEDCNAAVAGLSFVTLFLSFLFLLAGICLGRFADSTSQCETFLQKPTIVFAMILFAVSLAGVVGGYCRLNWLLGLYLLGMLLLIAALLCSVVFASVVTTAGAGEYSNWLQKRVHDTDNWKRIKRCLAGAKLCQIFAMENRTLSGRFLARNLSPMFKSGCCKPPESCNFISESPIIWTKNSTKSNVSNPDCNVWNNNPKALCFDCLSCKAAFLQDLKARWKDLALGHTIFIIVLIIFWCLGCFAFYFNRRVTRVHCQHIRPSSS